MRDPDAEAATVEYRERQASELMDSLSERVNSVSAAMPEGSAETVVSQVSPYSAGVVEAMLRLAPELIDAVAEHVEQTLCDPKANDAALMLAAQLTESAAGMASAKGFDCIFRQRAKEDIVLWTALDAWRHSGLPRTPGIADIERTATDERTRMRLKPGD